MLPERLTSSEVPTFLDCLLAAKDKVFTITYWVLLAFLPVTLYILFTSPPHTELGDGLAVLSILFFAWKLHRTSLTGSDA